MHSNSIVHALAGSALTASILSFILQWLPLVQFLAAFVAMVAGGISIYTALKKK